MNKREEFEKILPVIMININKRQPSWRLSVLDWEDVSQMLIIQIWNKFHLYDATKGPFENWVNRVISNRITNIIRDNHYKWGRPCILGCTYNLGCDNCGYTSSGKQCEECPLFANWKQKKEQQYNIKSSLSLEDHGDEVANVMTDFIDVNKSKEIIDSKIKEKLSVEEYKIYTLLFIQNKTMEEAGKILKLKRASSSHIPGYQNLLKVKKKIITVSRQIIIDEGLV